MPQFRYNKAYNIIPFDKNDISKKQTKIQVKPMAACPARGVFDTAFITLAVIHSDCLTHFGGNNKRTYKDSCFVLFRSNIDGQ